MTRLIRAELFKLRKRSMTWVLLSVLIGIVIIFYVVVLIISKNSLPIHGYRETLGFPMVIPFVLSILFPFGIILSVILITSSIGTEYNWRTIRTMLICSESRFKLLGAKLIAVGILMLIGMVAGIAAGFVSPSLGSDFQFECLPTPDTACTKPGGGPNQTVMVTVNLAKPALMPFFSQFYPTGGVPFTLSTTWKNEPFA